MHVTNILNGTALLQLSCDHQSNKKTQKLQTPVRITAFNFPPFMTLSTSLTFGGYAGQVYSIFDTNFNLSLEVISCKQKNYGVLINGSWTGMIGDLTKGVSISYQTDIAFGLVISRKRSDVVKSSSQIYPIQMEIIYRTSNERKWNYTFYLRPCNVEMWLCIFAISLIIILVKVLENYVLRRKHFGSCLTSFTNELLLCWPIVLQGSLIHFSLTSMKFFFGIYIVFSMLLLISYNSILTSLLATRSIKIPFSSLQEMIEKSDFKPVITKGNKMEEIFMNSPYENTTVLKVRSREDAIEEVYNGKYGYVTTLLSVQNLIRKNCSFAVAPQFISREAATVAYSKQFEYVDFFNCKILLLRQCGILSIQFKRFFPGLEKCLDNPFRPISFGQIIGPLIIIIAGISTAVLFGVIELIAFKFEI
uniref:Ionotropic glutamate receptor C-terminal domain-containing protein n=1 Tax=Strigamia maritima TaxID=126957 RepID=T1JL75_STRMM